VCIKNPEEWEMRRDTKHLPVRAAGMRMLYIGEHVRNAIIGYHPSDIQELSKPSKAEVGCI